MHLLDDAPIVSIPNDSDLATTRRRPAAATPAHRTSHASAEKEFSYTRREAEALIGIATGLLKAAPGPLAWVPHRPTDSEVPLTSLRSQARHAFSIKFGWGGWGSNPRPARRVDHDSK